MASPAQMDRNRMGLNFSGNRNRPEGTSGPGSGYTPGGDSFKNYSDKDQATMFNMAGGRDNFIQQAITQQEKYPRSLDFQKYLDRAKQYQTAQILGGKEVKGPDGIMRLQMAGADVPMKDAQGRTILSMMRPELTAQAPTFGQAMGDFGRGFSNFMGAIAERGTPMMAFAKDLLGGVQNFFGNQMDSQNAFVEKLLALSPEQRRIYNQLIFQPRMTREEAYARATGQEYAVGGITTL